MVYSSSGSTSSTGSVESIEINFIKNELIIENDLREKSHNERRNILSGFEKRGILNWDIDDYYYDEDIGEYIFHYFSWIHRSGSNGYFIG